MESNFLESALKQFKYYKSLGDKTFDQVSDEGLFWSANDNGNSIAVIVNHITGNMLSRWTDFLTADGEKSWRNRDQEFESVIENKAEMLEKWEAGWKCLFDALEPLSESQMGDIIYIRNMGHTITEAINRQLSHYPYHIGQIVFLGKMLTDDGWKSLSIPKGLSTAYNKEKFSKKKSRTHFTDDL